MKAGAGRIQKPEYQWAIIYLPGFPAAPFLKVPLVTGTYLYAQGSFDLKRETRMAVGRASIDKGVVATYKLFMLCHNEFFKHLDAFVELLNGFHQYCMTDVDSTMPAETAYALCTAIMPPTTSKDLAVHILVTAHELDRMTGLVLPHLRFSPSTSPSEEVER